MNNKHNINLINILYIKTTIKSHKVYTKNNYKFITCCPIFNP